jgi:hypothetical protein
MCTKTNERMSIDSKTISAEAIAADMTATIALLKRCSVSDTNTTTNTTTVPESKATPTIDMDVDTATNETAQTSEKMMEIDPSIPERSDVRMSDCAPRPQQRRLALLAGVDAMSLHRVLAPCIHRSRAQSAQRPLGLRSKGMQRQSRLASAAMQILRAMGDFACDVARDVEMDAGGE